MGASEGFQSLCSHSSDSTVPSFFSLQLRVLRDRYEFEYRSDHLDHVALVYSFHSMSLSCLSPRAFVFLSWLDTSFHFAITYWMLRDMFIDHDYLVFVLYTYHGLSTSFLRWILDSIFNSMLIFSLRKGERGIFHIHTVFERFTLITLLFFSYGARVEG